MRTTITLEDDVAIRLQRLKQKDDQTFKTLVNAVLRAGLDQLEAPASSSRSTYRLKPVPLRPRLPNLDNIAEVLASVEGEAAT